MFGGHGLFEDLQPIGLAMAALGLLPVVLWPGQTRPRPVMHRHDTVDGVAGRSPFSSSSQLFLLFSL